MEQIDQTFFPSANRRVLLGSVTKQPTTNRICIAIRMPLSGESLASCPDWVSTACEAVQKYLSAANPQIEQISDITVSFNNSKPKGKLFDDPDARIPAADLRSFVIQRCGDEDEPDVELVFKLYAPFSRDFWKWAGEMCGHEVYMAFPKSLGAPVKVAAQDKQSKLNLEPTRAEVDALQNDQNPEPDPPKGGKKKSGPAQLKDFHDRITRSGRKGAIQ